MRRRTSHGKRHTYCKMHGVRKIRHKTLADAKAFRKWIEEGHGKNSRIYKCTVCKGYHLTTREWIGNMEPPTVWREPKNQRSRGMVPYSQFIQPITEKMETWNYSPLKKLPVS